MTAYIPTAWCVKCNEAASVERRYDPANKRRFVVVEHHGERTEIGFSSQPGAQVKVFDKQGG